MPGGSGRFGGVGGPRGGRERETYTKSGPEPLLGRAPAAFARCGYVLKILELISKLLSSLDPL
jgi:hypothetical protein